MPYTSSSCVCMVVHLAYILFSSSYNSCLLEFSSIRSSKPTTIIQQQYALEKVYIYISTVFSRSGLLAEFRHFCCGGHFALVQFDRAFHAVYIAWLYITVKRALCAVYCARTSSFGRRGDSWAQVEKLATIIAPGKHLKWLLALCIYTIYALYNNIYCIYHLYIKGYKALRGDIDTSTSIRRGAAGMSNDFRVAVFFCCYFGRSILLQWSRFVNLLDASALYSVTLLTSTTTSLSTRHYCSPTIFHVNMLFTRRDINPCFLSATCNRVDSDPSPPPITTYLYTHPSPCSSLFPLHFAIHNWLQS